MKGLRLATLLTITPLLTGCATTTETNRVTNLRKNVCTITNNNSYGEYEMHLTTDGSTWTNLEYVGKEFDQRIIESNLRLANNSLTEEFEGNLTNHCDYVVAKAKEW